VFTHEFYILSNGTLKNINNGSNFNCLSKTEKEIVEDEFKQFVKVENFLKFAI